MASDIVQFRFPREDLNYLQRCGIHPNEAARERLQALVRSLRVGEAVAEVRRRPAQRTFDPVQAVREARKDL